MFGNSAIATLHYHVADLALAEVLKCAVRTESICVTVFETFLAGNDHHQRVLSGGDNATLLLASKLGMDVGAPIVNSANLKAPTHCTLHSGRALKQNYSIRRDRGERPFHLNGPTRKSHRNNEALYAFVEHARNLLKNRFCTDEPETKAIADLLRPLTL